MFRKSPPAQTSNFPANPEGSAAARNMFSNGTDISLHIYLSEFEDRVNYTPDNLFWFKENLVYGDWYSGMNGDGSYTVKKDLEITEKMRNNGSLYLHAYITRLGESPDPSSKVYGKSFVTYAKKSLNRYKYVVEILKFFGLYTYACS